MGGALDAPGYVSIGADGVEWHDAAGLWGLDVPASLERLRELHPRLRGRASSARRASAACSSPRIVNNRGRSIGRGGLGAVMGAKKLKAVVSSPGTAPQARRSPIPSASSFIVYEAEKLLKANPITSQALPEFGTSVLVNVLNQAGAFPTRNFRESQFEHGRTDLRRDAQAATTSRSAPPVAAASSAARGAPRPAARAARARSTRASGRSAATAASAT